LITEKGVEAMKTSSGLLMSSPGGGSSAIFGPDGRRLSEPAEPTTETIIYADLDFEEIVRIKMFADGLGHYSRPDLMWLGTCKDIKKMVLPDVPSSESKIETETSE
jgi:predicted amidohydrolase